MKTKTLLLSALVALILVACQKENSGMLNLTIEGMGSDTKMAVNGNVSYWAEGDEVLINGNLVTIRVPNEQQGNTATTSVEVNSADAFYGVYPASIYSDNTGASYTLDLPATYTYATTTRQGHTYQNLQSPMVGYTTGSSMQFKHVTGAINVQVVNYYGFTVMVDSIIVSSNLYKLCGETTVTLGNDITVSAADATVDSTQRVQREFDGGASLHVFAGDSAVVQIPVLPVGASNKFTVDVYLHKVDQPAVAAHFNKEQATAHSMDRSKIGYARTTFGGLFSVSASKKVVISQGNLQYKQSTGEWSFMSTQYGIVETNEHSVGLNYVSQDIISLFGWGTSGWNNGNIYYQPYHTTNSGYSATSIGYGYGPTDGDTYTYGLTGQYMNADWGYNEIKNGGNSGGRWRTPEYTEFYYILSTYSRGATNTVNGTTRAKYTFAVVNGVNGIILFPDVFETPNLSGNSTWGTINSYSEWTTSIVLDDWYNLEAAGAVFLPTAGTRTSSTSSSPTISNVNVYGYYWSCSNYTTSAAYAYQFAKSTNKYNYSASKYNGNSVRLVRDVQ